MHLQIKSALDNRVRVSNMETEESVACVTRTKTAFCHSDFDIQRVIQTEEMESRVLIYYSKILPFLPRRFPTRRGTAQPSAEVLRYVPFSRLFPLFALCVTNLLFLTQLTPTYANLVTSAKVMDCDGRRLPEISPASCVLRPCAHSPLVLSNGSLGFQGLSRAKPSFCGYLSSHSAHCGLARRDIWWRRVGNTPKCSPTDFFFYEAI